MTIRFLMNDDSLMFPNIFTDFLLVFPQIMTVMKKMMMMMIDGYDALYIQYTPYIKYSLTQTF